MKQWNKFTIERISVKFSITSEKLGKKAFSEEKLKTHTMMILACI